MTEIKEHPIEEATQESYFERLKRMGNKRYLRLLTLVVLTLALPMTVLVLSQKQDIRQHASENETLIEAETGTAEGAVTTVADSDTFGGKYIVFGSASTSPTQPSSTPFPTSIPTPKPTKIVTPTPIPVILPTSPPGSQQAYACDVTIGPGESISSALSRTSKVLCLRGGTYNENPTLSKSGVTVAAVKGERPIISGRVGIGANMIIDGINVTWNSSLSSSQHLVVLSGANNTILRNGEVWGAHSYAGILVTGGTTNFTISNMYVHDTYKSNDTNQDHLIYINNASYGVVERSLFVNSENGRGIKLGPPSGGTGGPNHITIRYNTFYNNTGPSNIQLSYGSHDNQVYRNAMKKSSSENITGYNLNGSNNVVKDNIGWESSAVFGGGGLTDGGGNIKMDPQYTSDYHNSNPAAAGYGKYAN